MKNWKVYLISGIICTLLISIFLIIEGYSEFLTGIKDDGVVFDFHIRDGIVYYTLGILALGISIGICILGITWYRTEKKEKEKEIE